MAAQMAPQTYCVEDTNLIRLSCIHQKVATKVLRYVFQKGSSSKPWRVPLLDYYASEGITIYTFRNSLSDEQRRKLDEDFQGTTYDITLLYKCLRYGFHGLAKEKDEKWEKEGKTTIESLITIVKNKRDKLAREKLNYTNLQLLNEVKDLQGILTLILKFSGTLFDIPNETIDQEISNVVADVTKYLYDEFQPTSFEEYKNQLFFDAQSEFFNNEGVKDTMRQYDTCMEDEVSPKNQVVDLSLPVDSVYTEMKLKGKSQSGQDMPIRYEDVLKDESQKQTDSIIVVSGPAGVGKTTFTKKMIRDFKLDINVMKYLLAHDHLLKADCRDPTIKSFNELLHQRMPNVSKYFKAGDMEKVALAQKLLVILDGLDELNKASSQLFEELLYLTKKFGITLVITTRPEKMEDLEQKLKYHNLKIKLIELLGIPKEKREELVIKYHNEIAKSYSGIKDISGLLKYVKETELRLDDLWRLPYNLILLTIIWSYDFKDVTSINTAPELYREILQLYRTRLKERLRSHEATRHLNGSQLDKIIDFFLYSLAKESFIGLMNNHINLPQEAYERLEDVCGYLKIPTEEMISAFLKRIPSADIIYGFPHKGLQDYLAAYYIWLEITRRDHNHGIQDILEGVTEFLLHKNVSSIVIKNTVRFLEGELKKRPTKKGMIATTAAGTFGHMFPSLKASSFIHDILKDIHGSSDYELPKFQNMFVCLLGMFYSENDVIEEDIKLEALRLLQGTGIRDRDGWITILNSVKCDEYVSSFISKQPQILEGNIQITDSSAAAYICLMKALKPPLRNAHKVNVDVDIEGDLTGAHELLQLISHHQFKVMRILINGNNSQEYVAMLKALTKPLKAANAVKVDITDIELLNSRELMNLIEKNNFTVRTLQVRDFEIDDANLRDYISVFNSSPHILEHANKMGVNINIKEDRTAFEQLLELVSSHHFKVKRILINEINFAKYKAILRALTKPLHYAQEAKKDPEYYTLERIVDICIDEDITNITEFLEEIKKINYKIGKVKVRDIQITDENFKEYTKLVKDLPTFDGEGAHNMKVDICIDEDIDNITEFLRKIESLKFSFGEFKVRDIQITNENLKKYTNLLQNLPLHSVDAHKVKVDICIDEDFTNFKVLLETLRRQINFDIGELKWKNTQITDKNFKKYIDLLKYLPTSLRDVHETMLMNHIRDKGLGVRTLELEGETLKINDETLSICTEALRSLPTLAIEDRGKIDIDIRRETSDVNTVMKEIARNQLPVNIFLYHDFKHPESPSTASVEDLNNVFERCSTMKYTGMMRPRLSIPESTNLLVVSVSDTPSYIQLRRFLDTGQKLNQMDICININVEIEEVVPLKITHFGKRPSLFLPNIRTEEDWQKACEMAKKLNPIEGLNTHFDKIFFPRLRLKGEELESLLSGLEDVKIAYNIVLPTSCKPSSEDVEEKLQQFTKTTLQCSGIIWGALERNRLDTILDMDTW